MTRKTLVALFAVIALVVPTLAVVPAAAQDNVPVAPSIPWVRQINHATSLYARFPSIGNGGPPDCAGANQNGATPRLGLEPRTGSDVYQCSFPAAIAGTPPPALAEVSFTSEPLTRGFNLTANDSLFYEHRGEVPNGMRMFVQVLSGTTNVGSTTFVQNSTNQFRVDIPIGQQTRAEFRKSDRITLRLRGESFGTGEGGLIPSAAPEWTISEQGARLVVRSSDTLRAATWTQGDSNDVRSLFPPYPDRSIVPPGGVPHIVGYFAIQSAFGLDDAASPDREALPEFTITRGDTVVPIGPAGNGIVPAVYNGSASQDSEGRAVWNFRQGDLDYRGLTAGEYNLTVNMPYHQGNAYRFGTTARILLSQQGVRLTPYDDEDLTTFPSPLETSAHELPPGGSSTFLFLANNTGAVNDSFRLDVTIVSQSPQGWSATVGGPNVLDRTVKLAPQESKLVTLVTGAPAGAPIGSGAIFQVIATSVTDPTAKSQAFIVTSTVSNTATREVDVIVPPRPIDLVPGDELRQTVYVWNRGTRIANISLEITTAAVPGWTEDLMLGDIPVKRAVLSNIKPGDIAGVDLRVTGPNNQADVSRSIDLNVTHLDAQGVAASRVVTFVLRPTAAVRVEILETINGLPHTLETTGSVGPQPCREAGPQYAPITGDQICGPDDGVDGTWFRIWVTNTGRRSDAFDLTMDNLEFARTPGGCEDAVFDPHTPNADALAFFFRNRLGERSSKTQLALNPGETGEVYLWRSADRDADLCTDDNFFSFVVQAKGTATGAIGRAGSRARAVDVDLGQTNDHFDEVLLEAAPRLPDYSSDRPLVDASQAKSRTFVGVTPPRQNITYFVRLTHAASWASYLDDGTRRSSDVRVTLDNVNRIGGWNVSIRNNTGILDTTLNPYSDNLTISNFFAPAQQRQAWFDREIEVRVAPPHDQNISVFAGESSPFTLKAFIPGTDASSTLLIQTVIQEFANVSLETDNDRIFAHPNEPAGYLLYINNTGSTNSTVTLRAAVDPAATQPNPNQWLIEPSVQTFPLAAYKNRTVALAVRPPPGASPGNTGEINVLIEYPPNPRIPLALVTKPLTLVTEVAARGTVKLSAPSTETTIAPGGFANFTMQLENTGSQEIEFRAAATEIPNWTVTLSSTQGRLTPGQKINLILVAKAPIDVLNDTRFSSIVRVVEIGNDINFDTAALNINIVGGKPIPSLSLPAIRKTVDRAGSQYFEVLVKNVGTSAGRIALTARSGDPAWPVTIQNARGDNITFVDVLPNDLVPVNVTVRSPFTVPEHAVTNIEISAEASQQIAKATLQAAIHDYGVHIEMTPARLDAIAGLATEWRVKIRNDGNDNDTVNVSANTIDIPDWSVSFPDARPIETLNIPSLSTPGSQFLYEFVTGQNCVVSPPANTPLSPLACRTTPSGDTPRQPAVGVRLEPGQVAEVRVVVKPPTNPLPIPRTYTMKFFVGTLGGQPVNIPKNESLAAQVNVLNYRAIDVDRDNVLEAAVDFDKNPANGFERFQEIFGEGVQSSIVGTGRLNGKASFFLDVPSGDRPYDGIADVWFDPETVFAYEIKHAVDVNGDNTPDYLIDFDRDGKIDKAFDSATGQFWNVVEVKAFGDDRIQYLIDTTNDGKPDRFYDPAQKLVTRTQPIAGDNNLVGLDTNNDNRIDKYYDIKGNRITDAKVYGLLDFAKQYWYFFVAFLAMVVVTIVLVSKRRREA